MADPQQTSRTAPPQPAPRPGVAAPGAQQGGSAQGSDGHGAAPPAGPGTPPTGATAAPATPARPKRPPARMIVLLLVVAGIGAWLWYNSHKQEGYKGGEIETTGTIEAVHVQLSFKVAGRIADVAVAEGTDVRPGEVVARLETQDLDVAVTTARASLESARAALAEARATARRTATDLRRQRELLAADATTPQQVDNARAAAEVGNAQVRARAAQIAQMESALHQVELQRSYAELRASDGGEVSEKVHQPGEMVMVGTPVVTLSQMDTVKVRAAVDETRVGAIRPGDPVRVRVYTFDKRWFDGEVTDIQPAGEFATRKDWGAQRRDIRTFSVTARLPNPEHLLKDGMTADVVIVPHAAAPTATRTRP